MIDRSSMCRVLLVSCVVCLAVATPARAQEPGDGEPGEDAAPGILDALASEQWTLEWLSNEHLRAIGDVELPLDAGTTFFADQIDIYFDTERLVAVGDVVFSSPEGFIHADRVEYELSTGTATFYEARGSMPLGANADPAQFAGQDADVTFWGRTVERLTDRQYRISGGGFTTCVQPTPRWDLATGNLTLSLDEHAIANNTVLRVKGVPVFYLPFIYYPLEEDSRQTGILMPTWGASTLRGGALSNAFFWAIDRSQDATFFHDWFTRAGQGAGVEYRYAAAAQSSGDFRFYRLDQNETEYTEDGVVRMLPANKAFELTGNMVHQITPRVRARARLDYFSDVISQQLYHQNVTQATRNRRVIEGGLSGSFGVVSTNIVYRRNELLSESTSSTSRVYGSTPRITTNVAPQRLFGGPVYAALDTEYAFLPDRRRVEGTLTQDGSFHRVDVEPSVRVPLSRLTYLSVNTSASYRSTYYSRSVGLDVRGVVDEPYFRQYVALRSEVIGPVFNRIWDRPGSDFAQRLKHVIEPTFAFDFTSRIADFERTPTIGDVSDFVVGGANRFTYGVVNRLFARGSGAGGAPGQAREFMTVGLQQTYYSDPLASRYDNSYQSTYGVALPRDFSPVALTARVSPSALVDANVRAEYDSTGFGLRMLSAGGRVNLPAASTSLNYSRSRSPDLQGRDFLSASTSLRWLDGRATGTYSLSWDIGRSVIQAQTVAASYLAQCCGVQFELQRFNYPDVVGFPIAADTRFNVGVVLAGLGTFSNFFGAFGGQ